MIWQRLQEFWSVCVWSPSHNRESGLHEFRVQSLLTFFVILGVALRFGRMLMDFPLWWDEAFVAVNFLNRGYSDLVKPLDYGQVCPLLFLWIELSLVRLFGFDEWTLRLFPFLCSVASVFLFRHAASLVLKGNALVTAVAIFAVSFHPIRHAADVKPYASDLLAALTLITIALHWWRIPKQASWLWFLALVVPVAIVASHPAVFVAGGLLLALVPMVWRHGSQGSIVALFATFVMTISSFGLLFLLFTETQSAATLSAMQPDWEHTFPPLAEPWRLPLWFLRTHTGHLMAYPCGGEAGGSTVSFLLAIVGGTSLWRTDRKTVVLVCVMPLLLAFCAAALHRYPYGGSARFMQYTAPATCLLIGAGVWDLLQRIPGESTQRRVWRISVAALIAIGVVPLIGELSHPYRSEHAERARSFARTLWPTLEARGEVRCVRWDYGIGDWNSIHLDRPVYFCNQAIYTPRKLHQTRSPTTPTDDRPLLCVLANPRSEETEEITSWLQKMGKKYNLVEQKVYLVPMSSRHPTRKERVEIYEFGPKPLQTSSSSLATKPVK